MLTWSVLVFLPKCGSKPANFYHHSRFQQLSFADLLSACDEINLHLTKEMAVLLRKLCMYDQWNSQVFGALRSCLW